MGSIIDRALDIINDHLKDQTSSFPDPISIKPMARGGEVLEDKYPTHYLPGVGRQVMAKGGMPNPVESALATARSIPDEPLSIPPSAPPAAGRGYEGRVQSPKLASTFASENLPGVIVSPRPGKGSGPRVTPEAGVPYEAHGYEGYGPQGESPTSDIEFSHATPDIAGTALPPPVQHPLQNEPRLQKVTENAQRIFKSPGFRKLVEDHVGLRGPLQVTPTHGTWLGEAEPSFILSHPDMQKEHADKLAHLLGFGFQQDAVVRADHNPNINEGTLAALIGHGKKLSTEDINGLTAAAKKENLDYTITKDGKAAKFLHFGSDEEYPEFLDKVGRIADSNGLKERYNARTEGSLINAQDYLPRIFGEDRGGEGVQDGTKRSPDLFGRIVDHVLAPYAKAVAGEGYRLSPERLSQTFGLTQDEEDKVRTALYPNAKGDRTTVPLMTGEEELDVRPTGARGNATVNDVLYALQNRAAEKGQIDPGDFSDKAKKSIASDIANEVKYHVDNSEKSAVGWYDAALKKAKEMYHNIFPELKTDKDKEMLFDAILGITSQGNDVHSNSVFAARVYDKMRNQNKTLPQAVKELSGGFGAQTKAIEGNLMKLHHLLDTNGFDKMRDLFNQKKTVSEWNKILREDPSFKVPGQEQLKMQGAGDQKVTGWMVFGPKIGSFINNLHGDYSTLTADLWFSRTWNRLLGHNFIHSPLAEQKQYRDFKDALTAEFLHHNGLPHEQYAGKTSEGQYVRDAYGDPKPWMFGEDMKGMSHDEFKDLVNDPERMQELASQLYEAYKGGGFKDKSDVRRRAKNWMENRDLPVAAPRGDKEREFQQNTVEEAQKLLKKKYGLDISIADIQAALWFHEKELFGKLGVAPERAQPADYADAAKNAMELINKGELYHVKSKAAPESWYWSKYLKKKAPKAYGGAITPIEIGNRDLDNEARRLILWSQAVAPLFGRADGGRVEYPVAMTKETDDLKKKHAKLKKMSPQEFLNETDPLHIGKGDRKVIDTFKHDIRGGHHLGPLKIYNNGGQDGRHRANAAKELGIKSVPVIDYRKAAGGSVDDAQNAVDTARSLTPMGFYSAAAEAASKIPQRAPIDQIINKVKGSPNVKAEELDWSGVRNAFSGQKSVDPKAVAQHLQAQLPPLQETVYGYDSNTKRRTNVAPRYKQYSFPGGNNYREVLMHLPEDEDYDYQSSHWGGKYDRPAVKNVVAHLRMADRGMYGFGDPEALHIEEVQSDWGQEGRDSGFRQKSKPQSMSQWAKQKYPDRFYDAQNLEQKLSDERFPRLTNDEHELMQEYELSQGEDKSLPVKGPHVTSTEGWTDLALKRALMEAAKGKYKKLTWTTGEDQADRYGLDKSYSQIHYSPDTKELFAKGKEDVDDIRARVYPDALHSFIGKELAQKLLDRPLIDNTQPYISGDKVHSLIGGQLAVEQKGMRDYYDRFLPNRLQKLISKLDPAAKVQLFGHKTWVPEDEDQDVDYSSEEEGDYKKVHSLEITPKLRAAILKGLPAYDHGGSVVKRAFDVISNLSR
jgi:hypothetical protein